MSEPTGVTMIPRDRIRRDGGTQPRAAIVEHVVADYAEAIGNGSTLPPVVVFYDGTVYWLADGFHRDAAHAALGLVEIACDVRAGERRDAVLYAVGANETHGLRRTNEDKRRSVLILLDDAEWSKWSDSEIARRARVSHTFVAKLRPTTCNVSSERIFVAKSGAVSTMDVAAIGRRAADYATLRADPELLYAALKEQRAAVQNVKKARRQAKEKALAGKIAAANAQLGEAVATGKRWPVIYADPEWKYETWSEETGMDRAADNHYPTTATAEICARPVADIAADDCVLFLWATVPMLPDALRVMAAWGFAYKSHVVWDKGALGTGYWFRNQHELLLVGTRGDIPAPAMGTQMASVRRSPLGQHSEKPAWAYELIEGYFPNLPKIELNARTARPGWDVWGAEAPEAVADVSAVPATELPALPRRRRKAA